MLPSTKTNAVEDLKMQYERLQSETRANGDSAEYSFGETDNTLKRLLQKGRLYVKNLYLSPKKYYKPKNDFAIIQRDYTKDQLDSLINTIDDVDFI